MRNDSRTLRDRGMINLFRRRNVYRKGRRSAGGLAILSRKTRPVWSPAGRHAAQDRRSTSLVVRRSTPGVAGEGAEVRWVSGKSSHNGVHLAAHALAPG